MFVKALLAMLSALRLVAGSKHAPRAFGRATWQAGPSSDQGIHKTIQLHYLKKKYVDIFISKQTTDNTNN